MRQAIPAEERLAVTLRFLATGDGYRSLGYLFKMSPQIISTIIPEVCQALIDVLKDSVKLPSHSGEWKGMAHQFEKQWNFPHCVGALDGKHVVLQAPFNTGSEFYNYKHTFSIVLMALADSDYFVFADAGYQGRISNGGVFKNTILYEKMDANKLMLPPDSPLFQRQLPVPYAFFADNAFPLSKRLLKPYPGIQEKGSTKRIFNYRLSR